MTDETPAPSAVLTLSCPDRPGIVRAVADFFFVHGCDIVESHQFGDADTAQFHLRILVRRGEQTPDVSTLRTKFDAVADEFAMSYQLHDPAVRPRLLIMVSKFDHCLYDLLYRWKSGQLKADIVGVVSNHRDLEPLAQWHDIPFHHVPVTPQTKPEAEARVLALVDEHDVDLVVLARYMQILSGDMCQALGGRAINIHHSFLPSFKGASPYRQAHQRGVKLIGATAHYVTSDLDEGPIIEQAVHRVDHQAAVDDLVALGRDLESQTLARAVMWHVQRRVILNGSRTIVFT
jgi:formyltetrahydrofolate deformylase